MQLGGPRTDQPAPTDVAAAITTGAATLGHRPAVTVLHRQARYEQSGTSLVNWAAKGAHLLELDHLVGPGATVRLLAPPCWTSASVALATWWLGGTVALTAGEPDGVSIGHPSQIGAQEAGHSDLLLGDGLDGAPSPDDLTATTTGIPAWTHEAQPLPDHPPTAQARGDLPALRTASQTWSQAELLAVAGALGEGTLGIEAGTTDHLTALAAVSLRPLLTGHATVVLRGVPRGAAAAERVTTWI
ncbi:MAG: hypothetical protein EA387_02035 [Nitriliruptor sp.]|nr:MAG: hypothetical protein EA387_02035 [Nitriliruptor sp.]